MNQVGRDLAGKTPVCRPATLPVCVGRDLAGKTLEQRYEDEISALVKAARPHLMKAWATALRLGHKGGFDEWIAVALTDLADEVVAAGEAVPMAERKPSPWGPGAHLDFK